MVSNPLIPPTGGKKNPDEGSFSFTNQLTIINFRPAQIVEELWRRKKVLDFKGREEYYYICQEGTEQNGGKLTIDRISSQPIVKKP